MVSQTGFKFFDSLINEPGWVDSLRPIRGKPGRVVHFDNSIRNILLVDKN